MGFQQPSRIQERALPLLLANPPRNLIGQSQSGTGKTAAFTLTMLSRINFAIPETQAICLAPARELARQIMDVVKEMGKFTPVTTTYALKDSIPRGQKVNAHIVVGTPGTVMDLIRRRQLDTTHVRVFILDEADNMIDQQGLGDHSLRVKQCVSLWHLPFHALLHHFPPHPRLHSRFHSLIYYTIANSHTYTINHRAMSPTCQIVLFSATFAPSLREFAMRFAPDANMITLKTEELSVDAIKQFYMDCSSEDHKIEVLQAIYGLLTIGQSIIFVKVRLPFCYKM